MLPNAELRRFDAIIFGVASRYILLLEWTAQPLGVTLPECLLNQPKSETMSKTNSNRTLSTPDSGYLKRSSLS